MAISPATRCMITPMDAAISPIRLMRCLTRMERRNAVANSSTRVSVLATAGCATAMTGRLPNSSGGEKSGGGGECATSVGATNIETKRLQLLVPVDSWWSCPVSNRGPSGTGMRFSTLVEPCLKPLSKNYCAIGNCRYRLSVWISEPLRKPREKLPELSHPRAD